MLFFKVFVNFDVFDAFDGIKVSLQSPLQNGASPSHGSKFLDINSDCILTVMELEDVATLISLYETNKKLSSLVDYVMQQKLAKKSVKIVTPNTANSDQAEKDDSITIDNFVVASKMLKYFGKYIMRMELDFPTTDNQTEEIEELVNLHCSQTLFELIVRADNGDIFRSMTKPFQKVENILLKKHIKSLCNNVLNFNDLFPNLRSLNFVYVKVSDTRCIEQEFPHLEHLSIDVNQFETYEYFTVPVLERFMQKNTHLKSVSLQLVWPSVLKLVAENLPELESLEIVHYYETNETHENIQFEKVHTFKMKQSSFSAPSNVTFDELKELIIDGCPTYCHRWLQFIEKHPKLQRLTVIDRDLSTSDIIILANSRFNVNEISFHSNGNIDGDDIAYLIKQTNLQKITMKQSVLKKGKCHDCHGADNSLQDDQNSFKSIKNTLQHFLGYNWDVRENDEEIIIQKNQDSY